MRVIGQRPVVLARLRPSASKGEQLDECRRCRNYVDSVCIATHVRRSRS